MHGKKYEDTKKEIRSVLLTYKDTVTLQEFLKTYRSLVGQRLPSRDLGFSTDFAFLQSMPDVVDVKSDSHGAVLLSGIADKSSQHIKKLVSRQKQSKPSSSKHSQNGVRQPLRKLPNSSFNSRVLNPFLPGALRAEILELMSSYRNGVSLSAFVLAYLRRFNKYLNLPNGMNSLEAWIRLIPELEIRNENNERMIYDKRCSKYSESEKESYRKNGSSSGIASGKNVMQEKGSFYVHKSGIPDDILKNFRMIMQKYPDGIQNIHFPPLYENITGKEFDVVELGYNSVADLVQAVPDLFKRVSNPDDEQHWLIYPAESQIEQNFKTKDIRLDSPPKKHREGIPADVSSPTLQYIQLTIPDSINLNEYIPVFVSAIANPTLFWFQLQTEEFVKKFEKLEKDMENFYSNANNEYKMNSVDIAIGATCVIQCPEDNLWYRGVIKSIPSTELVNVSFVDYGSRSNVPINNVHYVWSQFHDYPAYGFKAKLANLRPSGNADSWSDQASKRFVELCNSNGLMALIKTVENDSYSVCLCDVSGDEDVFLKNVLIIEGYAEDFGTESNILSDPEKNSDSHSILADSESDASANQDALQSDSSGIFSGTNDLPVNRKLSFSTDIENNAIQPNASNFNTDKTSRKYVKQVEICEGSKIHLINFENKLFMSCDELSSLLWNEKNADFLMRRLKDKEIAIPFLCIKKEDCVELFKQCLWYKIPGFEKIYSDDSSLVLCPLEEAFNVLNIFGQPSICLRVVIQHERKTFNPQDELWNEFSYEEAHDLSAAESHILEEINKLCLYDLKVKCNVFEIQRLKLLRLSSPSSEEIRRIENILTIIKNRMKQIDAICAQYSSCS